MTETNMLETRSQGLYGEILNETLIFCIPKKIRPGKPIVNAVGIDLGTTRCCAAASRKYGIETVAIDNTGERQLPSYISFREENETCGNIVLNQMQHYSNSSIFDSKRIIGKNFKDLEINANWPFEVLNFNDEPIIQVQGPENMLMKNPEEIAAVFLKHIKRELENFQGTELDEVVITVPAAFTNKQKIATQLAGYLAGWKKVMLLPEPVAAAFAYYMEKEDIPNNIKLLLFDLGGGTLDVCIFRIDHNMLEIISNTGDINLGGRDFDQILVNHFQDILLKKHLINVNSSEKLKYRLLVKCMEIKHILSSQKAAFLDVSDFNSNIEAFELITRKEFEEMSESLVEKIITTIENSLISSDSTEIKVDKVLRVGGATRMPMIMQLLEETFPTSEQCYEQNPDEAVAIGAACYAYYLNSLPKNSFHMNQIMLYGFIPTVSALVGGFVFLAKR